MAADRKNPDIECLRAIAIVMTLVQHAEVLLPWKDSAYWALREHLGFWTGVDLFFCVSGFVITRALMHWHPVSPGEDRLVSARLGFWRTAGAFWIQRAWRLWPAAWLWVAVALLCTSLFNRSGIFGSPGRMGWDALAAVLQVANIHWADCYVGALQRCNVVDAPQVVTALPTGWSLLVYWSLSLEEQFYLLAPLLLLACPRRWLRMGLLLALLLQLPLARPPLGGLWFFRTDALLLGVGLAWAAQAGVGQLSADRVERWRWPLRLAALALVLGLCALGAAPRSGYVGAVSAVAALSAGLVWIAGQDRSLLIGSGRLRALLLWLGSRSYSLYLAHLVVFFATREIWFRVQGSLQQPPTWASLASAALLLLVCAEATHVLVERPLRQHGRAVARRWLQRAQGAPARQGTP